MTHEDYLRIEEEWNNQYEIEKNEAIANKASFKAAEFSLLVSSLSMQAMIAMGKLEAPGAEGEMPINFEQARFMIDSITMIYSKAEINLSANEKEFVKASLYHLRLNYLELING